MESDNGGINNRRAYILLIATAAIWGLSWLCGRVISSAGVPAPHAALGRFLFGSAGLLVVMLANRPWPGVSRNTALQLAGMGFCGVFLYNVCFFSGLRTVPAGRASLMASLQPSIVFLFSAIAWRERVTLAKASGLIVSFCGALLVLSQGDFARLFRQGLSSGDVWIAGCVFSWVAYTLLGRPIMSKLPAGAATAYSTWFGTVLLCAYALLAAEPQAVWSPVVWLATAFLGFGATTLAFMMYLKGLAHIGPSRTSIFVNLVPVFGVLFSALLLGERIGLPMLAGGCLVIAGVRMLNRN